MKKITLSLLLILGLTGSIIAQKKALDWPKIYADQLFKITEVMVTDVASPPVAARIYAYTTLASYLAIQPSGTRFTKPDFLSATPIQADKFQASGSGVTNFEFPAIYAMLLVGEKVIPSGYLLKKAQEDWISWGLKNKIFQKKDLALYLTFAQDVADFVLEYAKKDGYIQLTALPRYSPKEGEGYWYPTPPAYMAPVEPEWRTMKTFFLRNLTDFDPKPMAPFDLDKGSSFQIQLEEVYTVTQNLTEEQKLIANFWDCNPFKVEFSGHMAIGVKKISPGGHWIGITGIAAQKANLNFAETAYIHALVGLTLHDAFVSCWKAKYDTDRIRPETAINQKVDQSWRPLLQTPPFPEYTSGHSVISTASAVVLTAYFGDNFSFLDTSELYFGLPERPFDSFLQASQEAAISRLYGGIHYRDAIENGVEQGDKIARYILQQTQF
ncbi:vanadium-dependent haloperoxidase [Algoriphagus mannitolivorans]|uniref:vanadium-dependent haloperoxidase n=1 Tax=Algoriphagus mannitolivorans TaxID=226504 RepID=UPI0004068F73|nr:vanadium-dependent haloperoxidase [Algoriphagus mannitolivorans]